jgi:hypothetical protein
MKLDDLFKFGDMAHAVFHPIAVGSDAVLGTNLQNCQSCIGEGGRQDRWNQFGETVYDELFQPKKRKEK